MSTATIPARLIYRQPLSTVQKIVVWSLSIATFAGIAGNAALYFASGSSSQDLIAATIVMIVALVCAASGVRWASLITTICAVYLVYVAFTEPYAIESLANPKGPNGGLYHFVGNVILGANSILTLGASFTAFIQDFHTASRVTPRWFPAFFTALAGAAIGAIFIGAISQPSVLAGTTYTNGVPTVHLDAGSFLQSSVTIPKGSQLVTQDDSTALHILENGSWQGHTARYDQEAGAPVVQDVHLSGNSAEIGTFNTIGTFHIYCKLHPGMTLTIIVQ